MEPADNRKYRTDVDGLRGAAVAMIVVFHLSKRLLPGGFVGVDVFFVISGWLITDRIAKDHASGNFSFLTFFSRRVRRITPASFVCIALTIIAIAYFMRGAVREQALGGCRAAALSAANLYFAFWVPSGYFDPSAELNPALHLWSLALEEQFYFVWPTCVLMLMRVGPLYRAGLVGALIAGSTLAGELLFVGFPKIMYYTLVARAGEFAMGASLVFAEAQVELLTMHRWAVEVVGLAGLALLSWSGCCTLESPFPGVAALVPCFGAAFCILSGYHSSSLTRQLLSFRPFVLLGTISYSVYLYHWPVFSFLRYLGVDLVGIHGASALLYVLALSIVSYCAVEQPFRSLTWRPSTIILLLFVLPSLGLLGATFIAQDSTDLSTVQQLRMSHSPTQLNVSSIQMTAAWSTWANVDLWDPRIAVPQHFKEGVFPLTAVCTPYTRHICMDGCEVNVPNSGPCPCIRHPDQCWFGPVQAAHKPILLVGDSMAAAYIGALEEFALVSGFRVFNNIHSGTEPWLFSGNPKWKDVVDVWLPKFDVVALGAYWHGYFGRGGKEKLRRTLDALLALNKTVILLGEAMIFPHFGQDCPNLETLNGTRREQVCARTFPVYNLECNVFLQHLAATACGVLYWDINSHICKGGQCSPYHALCDGARHRCTRVRLHMDAEHLSYYGAKMLGDEILRESSVPWVFSAATETSQI
jgi:peptidoglycan/LPS O-acetylase OafA/YrhL